MVFKSSTGSSFGLKYLWLLVRTTQLLLKPRFLKLFLSERKTLLVNIFMLQGLFYFCYFELVVPAFRLKVELWLYNNFH